MAYEPVEEYLIMLKTNALIGSMYCMSQFLSKVYVTCIHTHECAYIHAWTHTSVNSGCLQATGF